MQEVSETDKKLTEYDVCQRCLRTCYRKDIRYSTYHGYICKHCRVDSDSRKMKPGAVRSMEHGAIKICVTVKRAR